MGSSLPPPAINEGLKGLPQWSDGRSSVKLQCSNSIKLALCLRVTSIRHPVKVPKFKTSSQDGREGRSTEGLSQMLTIHNNSLQGASTLQLFLVAKSPVRLCGQCCSLEIQYSSKDITQDNCLGYMMFYKQLCSHGIKPFKHRVS